MNRHRLFKYVVFLLFLVCCFPRPALAYVGPGTGMSAVGVFLAVVMGVVVALIGFVWYPCKRLLRTCKKWIAANKNREPTT
jgi:hypothetical protein